MRKLRFKENINLTKETEPGDQRAGTLTQASWAGSEHLTTQLSFSLPYIVGKKTQETEGFPGGAVIESPPANAGDTGLSPDLERSHMPRSN